MGDPGEPDEPAGRKSCFLGLWVRHGRPPCCRMPVISPASNAAATWIGAAFSLILCLSISRCLTASRMPSGAYRIEDAVQRKREQEPIPIRRDGSETR